MYLSPQSLSLSLCLSPPLSFFVSVFFPLFLFLSLPSPSLPLPSSPSLWMLLVLYEFPEEEKAVTMGTDDSVACGIKTYSSASVSWWSNMKTLVPMIEEDAIIGEGLGMSYCGEQSDVFVTRTITKQENGFALFLVRLHFCNLSPAHLGQYSCVVDDKAFDSDICNTTFAFTLRGLRGQ